MIAIYDGDEAHEDSENVAACKLLVIFTGHFQSVSAHN